MSVARLNTIIDTLANRDISNAVLTKVADSFVAHWQGEFDQFAVDPENPTNAEKATFTVNKIREFVKDIHAGEARKTAKESTQSTIDTAGSDAEAEVEE